MRRSKKSALVKDYSVTAPIRTTLLDVVTAVASAADNDGEVVAVIHHLFASGRMRLIGEFTERDFAI